MNTTPTDNSQITSTTDAPTEGETKPVVLISLIALIVLAVFAVFVWPTQYMYDHMGIGEGSSFIVRIDRFSGDAEWLMPNQGWKKIEQLSISTPAPAKVVDPSDTPTPSDFYRALQTLTPKK